GFANGGAYPPDLSLITKARYNGQNYVFPFLLATVILLLVLRNITLVKHDVQHYFSGECVKYLDTEPFISLQILAIKDVDVAELGLSYLTGMSMIRWSFSILYTFNIFSLTGCSNNGDGHRTKLTT
ncbi:hypothetical protein MKW98_021697, partial [Papaver atlanticum]